MEYRYQLEEKKPYTLGSELNKSDTRTVFRWVGIALSNDKELLKKYLNESRRIIEFEI